MNVIIRYYIDLFDLCNLRKYNSSPIIYPSLCTKQKIPRISSANPDLGISTPGHMRPFLLSSLFSHPLSLATNLSEYNLYRI